jgi:nucleotide-binding universal stress UspA family protein
MGRIVVGVDGSEPSLKALRWAVRQAKLTGDQLEAAISWDYPNTSWSAVGAGSSEINPENLARQILDEAVDKTLDREVASTIGRQVVAGHAAQVLIDLSEGAELLVVGDRGHSGFAAALLGSVSHHVTQHSTCPVVVVRGETAEG